VKPSLNERTINFYTWDLAREAWERAMAKQRDLVFTGEENRIFKYNNYHLAINGIF
jgi:hypothetical protein